MTDEVASLKRRLSEILQCPVCLVVPRDAVLLCPEGHAACQKCIDNSDTCPVCRGQLKQKKRIRGLVLEQVLEALDFDHPCKHNTCDFSANKTDLVLHEKKCTFRLVPCPDPGCDREYPLSGVLGHIENIHIKGAITHFYTGHVMIDYLLPIDRDGPGNLNWSCRRVLEYEDYEFLPCFTKKDGVYYAWIHVIGNSEDAVKFSVTLSVGEATKCMMFLNGPVYPIDMKKADVLNDKSGVLSFSHLVNKENFFKEKNDGDWSTKVSFRIREAETLPQFVVSDESNMQQAAPSTG